MANALTGNFGPLAAIGYVQEQGELGRKRGIDNQLNQLASLSYSANTPQAQQANLSQVAALDRSAAAEQQKTFQSQEDRNRKELYGLAQGWKKIPSQYRQNYYDRFLSPRLSAMGMGEQPAYDEASIDGAADQIIAAFGQNLGTGQGVQSTYVDEGGNRVAIMRDGSTQVLGRNDAGANQQTLNIDVNGVPTQVTFDRRTGRYTNANLGAPQRPLQQIDGQPTYIDPSLPPQVQAAIRAGAGTNLQDGGQLQVAQGMPLVGRRKEDEAFAVANAKNAADNANFNTSLEQDRLRKEQEARIEADKAMAVQQAKAQEERAAAGRAKSAALNNVKRGITRIDKALTAIEGLRFADSGPIDQYAVARTKEGQELVAAVGAIQDSMLALTRVPGVGSQSDLEAKMANLKYPDLGNYPTVNRNNYSQLKDFASDLERQFGGSDTGAETTRGPQPGTVEDGYRFRGGNPSDPNSWERI